MTNLIRPLPVENGIVSLEEVLRRNKELQRERKKQRSSRQNVAVPVSSVSREITIEETPVGYQLRNVPHRFGRYDLLWSKALLPGAGKVVAHTQDDWLWHYEYRTVDGVVFDIPSGPEYASTMLALYQHRSTMDAVQKNLLKDLKKMLAGDFEQRELLTSTRVRYRPAGDDGVMHCRNRIDVYSSNGAVAGSSGSLQPHMTQETSALFGVTAVQEFMDAVKWLTKKDAFLWRNEKPMKYGGGHALVLGAKDDNRFIISAKGNISIKWPARGVFVRDAVPLDGGGAL